MYMINSSVNTEISRRQAVGGVLCQGNSATMVPYCGEECVCVCVCVCCVGTGVGGLQLFLCSKLFGKVDGFTRDCNRLCVVAEIKRVCFDTCIIPRLKFFT